MGKSARLALWGLCPSSDQGSFPSVKIGVRLAELGGVSDSPNSGRGLFSVEDKAASHLDWIFLSSPALPFSLEGDLPPWPLKCSVTLNLNLPFADCLGRSHVSWVALEGCCGAWPLPGIIGLLVLLGYSGAWPGLVFPSTCHQGCRGRFQARGSSHLSGNSEAWWSTASSALLMPEPELNCGRGAVEGRLLGLSMLEVQWKEPIPTRRIYEQPQVTLLGGNAACLPSILQKSLRDGFLRGQGDPPPPPTWEGRMVARRLGVGWRWG